MTTALELLTQVETKRQDIEGLEQRIAAAAGEVYEQRLQAEAELKALEADARKAAQRHTAGATILGRFLQLVRSDGTTKLDADKVRALLEKYNKGRKAADRVTFEDLCSTGEPSWSIRKRGKG